jgi:hypothetical protein
VFDPTRDHDQESVHWLVRILIAALAAGLVAVAVYPSIAGFTAGSTSPQACVPLLDAWPDGVPSLSPADQRVVDAVAARPAPTPEELRDPAAKTRLREEWSATRSLPAVQRANALAERRRSEDACLRESRRRLLLTMVLLGVLMIVAVVVTIVYRARLQQASTPHDRIDRSVLPAHRLGPSASLLTSPVVTNDEGGRVPGEGVEPSCPLRGRRV